MCNTVTDTKANCNGIEARTCLWCVGDASTCGEAACTCNESATEEAACTNSDGCNWCTIGSTSTCGAAECATDCVTVTDKATC